MLRDVVGFSPLGLPGSILGTSDGTTPEPTHTAPHIMRKIEVLMNNAISTGKDFKSGNTSVITISDVSFVYLYDNLIATITDNSVEVYDGDHQTATTKSRLNAILKEHAIKGECIVQKNFKWYVHKFVGQAGSTPVFNEQEFTNGFIFA
jgi:hypothetical protein